jgi:hypothetical protein
MEYFNTSTDANTGEVITTPYTDEQIAEVKQQEKIHSMAFNKQQAKDLLSQTDWTISADVTNSTLSNPYLTNSAEFIDYRNKLRAIVFNPPDIELVFPIAPEEIWQTVQG